MRKKVRKYKIYFYIGGAANNNVLIFLQEYNFSDNKFVKYIIFK